MKEIIIKARDLCKRFEREGTAANILTHLDIDIYKGDFTVIMGPSGAGKSTLMYVLSGMDKPSSGFIEINGKEISNLTSNELAGFRKEHCGFVFQQMFLLEYMSIMDNILAAGILKNHNKKELIQKAKELFNKVHISEDIQKKYPNQVSGGEAQRCAIVRAIVNDPEVVFADEPTGALNSAASLAVLDILSDINEKGQSVIMVTHDIKSALRGNRVLFFRDGKVCGNCGLGKYVESDEKREKKLRDYLQEMNW